MKRLARECRKALRLLLPNPLKRTPLAADLDLAESQIEPLTAVEFESIRPLAVRPPEREPGQPWPMTPNLPSALSIDFGDVAEGLVAIRAGSLRGATHTELSQPRQDAYQVRVDHEFIHLAVADGVGDATLSHTHIGAEVAVQTAVEFSQAHARHSQIGDAVAAALSAKAEELGIDALNLSTTLCWARVTIGDVGSPWHVETSQWGDSCVLVYDTRKKRGESQSWRRLVVDTNAGPLNVSQALPIHTQPRVDSAQELWFPGEVFGLYSDGITLDLRYNSPLGVKLAEAWTSIPTPWDFLGHLAFRLSGALDDRTAIVLWRRDEGGPTTLQADAEVPQSRAAFAPSPEES
jgi:hypothetical protein